MPPVGAKIPKLRLTLIRLRGILPFQERSYSGALVKVPIKNAGKSDSHSDCESDGDDRSPEPSNPGATAEAEDDESEEDLLVLTAELNVFELIEDELIMSAPIVPMHEACPTLVPMSAVDEAFEEALEARPNPFAALAKLKNKPN